MLLICKSFYCKLSLNVKNIIDLCLLYLWILYSFFLSKYLILCGLNLFSVVPHGLIMKQEGLGIVPSKSVLHIAEWSLLSVVTSWHPPPPAPRLSQLWHSPNPGLQDLAWSSFACSLTSPLSLILEHHVPTTSAFFQFMEHVNLFTAPRILQVLFLCLEHVLVHTYVLMYLPYGWLFL